MSVKVISLLSGGLDSILTTKLMKELGYDVTAVHYYIEFAACGGGTLSAEKAAKALGVPLEIFDITDEYLEIFKNPRHGYGANINPCIDCKIFMLKKAKEYMAKIGASFLVTGEVLGERPMSQRKDALNLIEKQAGVRGILLRPLTAKNLDPTIPEKEGIVDREKLLDIRGRSRRPQMALAEKFGIKEYPNPSGGCLLTDPGYARRVRDLMSHNSLDIGSLRLLKYGRHFRLAEDAKLAVGRDSDDNASLLKAAGAADIVFKMKDHQGPVSILSGEVTPENIETASAVTAYHTKRRGEAAVNIDYWKVGCADKRTITVKPADTDEVERMRI